jgi:hypothetical protein
MDHRVGLHVLDDSEGGGLVGEVDLMEAEVVGDGFAVPGRQVVENADVMPCGEQSTHGVRADVPGAAGDEDVGHG